jgi:imidazolonepropionase-like amidohydrolase
MSLVLQNGDLIDGKGLRIPGATVVVEGTRIAAVGSRVAMPAPSKDDEVIDARGLTVLPGLIDLHVHLHGQAGSGADPHLLTESNAYLAVILAENARRTLEAGFTTIRDMGAPNDINIDLARAIRNGVMEGPRVIPTATIDMTELPDSYDVHGSRGGITGPVEARKLAREKIMSGAEVIHVKATGAGFGKYDPNVLILTVEEMQAAIEETHKLGRRTTAHACGSVGMKNAVIAGTKCIEHGQYLYEDPELIQMMTDRRVGWVPTLMNNPAKIAKIREARAQGRASGLPENVERRIPDMVEAHRRSYEQAMEAGILVPIGSDCGAPFTPNGTNAKEMEFFVEYGATPMQAIEAGTRIAAEVLGMADRLGTVEPGKEADLVVIKEDPLKDIRVLQKHENIILVIQAGRIVVDRRGRQESPERPHGRT